MKIEGLDELIKSFEQIASKLERETLRASNAGAQLVRSSAIQSIQTASPSKGPVFRYRAGGNRYKHSPAMKGNAPNTDTGSLVRSIQVEPTRNGSYVGSELPYAATLEETHPWLIPAVDRNMAAIQKLFDDATKRAFE